MHSSFEITAICTLYSTILMHGCIECMCRSELLENVGGFPVVNTEQYVTDKAVLQSPI